MKSKDTFERRTHKQGLAVIKHQGIFRRQISLWEGVALIVSSTVGAGVLGIPYAVAQAGVLIGLVYIVSIGILIIGLNLLLGEVATQTKQELQLAGLARKYIGRWGEWAMTIVFYSSILGALLVYLIGEGKVLSQLVGGAAFWWSIGFFVIATFLIAIGVRTIKRIELFLMLGVLIVVLFIAGWSAPHVRGDYLAYTNVADLLFPYGVVLFSFFGLNAIPEVHAILVDQSNTFKKAIVISGVITIIVYAAFALAVVGVTGVHTTQVATLGLGNAIGPIMILFGNIFAVLAMGTSYLIVGLSFRDSLHWDFHIPRWIATTIMSIIPLVLFLFGVRSFINTLDVVGGVFISIAMLLTIWIYWSAQNRGDVPKGKFHLHHTLILAMVLVLALSFGAVYSVLKLFY